jgi:hypothetical protein
MARDVLDLVSDLRIDLDLVGIYIAQSHSPILHSRIKLMLESFKRHATYQQETIHLQEQNWEEQ